MAIATLADYQAAAKQDVRFLKSTLAVPPNFMWYSGWYCTGVPTAGGNPGNTANGVVPTVATTGAPPIADFSGGSRVGYLSRLRGSLGSAAGAGQYILYDRLFHAGPYAFNDNVALTAQPSYAARVPGGTDYTGTQLWYEQASLGTGVQDVTVQYTNQSGATAHVATIIQPSNGYAVPWALQIPLQAGDCGVQLIKQVTASTATGGTFNIIVARPIARFCFPSSVVGAGVDLMYGMDSLGLPQVFADSCLSYMFRAGGAQPIPDIVLEIASN